MRNRRWIFAACSALCITSTVLIRPTPVVAQTGGPWCRTPVVKYCRGAAVGGGWLTGYVGCDAGNACRCPLPAHDYTLIFNECFGQAQ